MPEHENNHTGKCSVCLKRNKYVIKVPEEIRIKAKQAVDRMLTLVS